MDQNFDKRANSKYWSISWVWSWARFRFGLVKKIFSKIFQNLLCRNFDKFGSCPLSLHAFSYPIKSRNCPDSPAILSDMISALFSIYMWKVANIITLILLDAEDLNRRIWKTMEPAKILIFRSKIDEKFEFHSWLNLVENWTRMQLTTFHNTNSINQI